MWPLTFRWNTSISSTNIPWMLSQPRNIVHSRRFVMNDYYTGVTVSSYQGDILYDESGKGLFIFQSFLKYCVK